VLLTFFEAISSTTITCSDVKHSIDHARFLGIMEQYHQYIKGYAATAAGTVLQAFKADSAEAELCSLGTVQFVDSALLCCATLSCQPCFAAVTFAVQFIQPTAV
jgi:hypothetical protein